MSNAEKKIVTSRYIQINSWALLEYEYSNEEIKSNISKIINKHTGANQFINKNNTDISEFKFKNILDNTALPINSQRNKWFHSDVDNTQTTYLIDNDYIEKVPVVPDKEYTLSYDTIKIHIVSGFNLDGMDGLIAQCQFQCAPEGVIDISSLVYFNDNENGLLNFNSSPIFLGDRMYDKTIEFKIPAFSYIKSLENDFSFSNIFCKEDSQIKKDGLILFSLYEIDKTEFNNLNEIFLSTGNKYEVSFLSEDVYSNLSGVIKESNTGDYFEYYAAYNNNIKDFNNYINNLNNGRDIWVVSHLLEVYEHIDDGIEVKTVKTDNITNFQNTKFGEKNKYRPIVLNTEADSFEIKYTMRLLNSDNGQQLIRKANIINTNPNKYGENISKINIGASNIKVYNRIESGDNIDVTSAINHIDSMPIIFDKPDSIIEVPGEPGEPTIIYKTKYENIIKTKYIPTYYNQTNISLSTTGNNAQELNNNIFGQGSAILFLNEYDNIIRFKLYDKKINNAEFNTLNITTFSNIRLSFILDNGQKIYIKQTKSYDIDPLAGEIEFLINSDISYKLLNIKDKRFFIISDSEDGQADESVVYQGIFENFSNRNDVINEYNKRKEIDINKSIIKLQELNDELDLKTKELNKNILLYQNLIDQNNININKGGSVETDMHRKIEDVRRVARQETEILSRKTLETKEYINKSIQNNKGFILKEIPGEDLDLGSSITQISPKITTPSNPNKIQVITKIKKGSSDNNEIINITK